ncbi:MAG: SEC-C metal-binding domain-containing protein [Verrucomicrobiota bacterium]
MAKVERNDPCPCGSGKKYKKCCLAADDQRQNASSGPRAAGVTFMSDLDDLSNSVIDLIEAGDLTAAEAACRQLQQRYPEQVDGIMRLAAVQEAQGDRSAAARSYREAAEFMRSHEGFEDESIVDMIESAKRMEG